MTAGTSRCCGPVQDIVEAMLYVASDAASLFQGMTDVP